jgi:hypothetical protein
VVRSATVHGYTNAFEVSALLVAMAAAVAGVLVRSRRHHEGVTPHSAETSNFVRGVVIVD